MLKLRVAAVLLAPLLAIGAVAAETATHTERYAVVHGWPELPPGEILGQATGVDIDSKGRVWVFHRAGREWSEPFPADPIPQATVWVFDAVTGRRLESWGAGLFIMPHGITIDRDDNVWLTDVGRHQVFKFSPDGRPLLTLGEAGVPGNDERHFNLPTDVVVADDGSFFVSDGYGNARVLKFAADGRLLQTWGVSGSGPGEFDLPHGIAIDAAGRVFVADGGDQPDTPPDRSGVAVANAEGHVMTRFGRFGNQDGQFRLAHDLAVAQDGAVYVVDAWGQRVQKFAPQ